MINTNKLYYGAAYYPELWNEKTVEQDIKYMKEAGINVARIGEFAWTDMEPEQDKINLDFFVNIINKLYENGIETVMCTPTPTPPRWLTHNHSERMHVDENGITMSHGGRQHICTNNQYFRDRTRIIAAAVAKACGSLPGVIGWQIDNEFKCGVAECFCETCKGLWHDWLRERYGTIDKLNEEWGTHIWSQYYNNFEQIPQPVKVPAQHNSSLTTMYRLFHREKVAEYSDMQAEIIRKYSKAPITHNTSIGYKEDDERLFKNLDMASFDGYADCDGYANFIMNYDMWRSTKKGVPFWVMETSPYHNGGLKNHAKIHRVDYLRAEAVAAYALGASGFSYWLWRQQRTGCEQPHGAILSSWGEPTIGFKEVVKASDARKEIEKLWLDTSPVQAEVAITHSERARVFFMTEPLEDINYLDVMKKWYNMMLDTGIYRDVTFEGANLDGYKLLMTPFIPYLSDEYIDRAKAFVEAGGTWIVGPISGGRTEEHTVHTDAGLGRMDELGGVRTLHTFHMTNAGSVGKAFDMEAPLGMWSSIFRTEGAKAVGKVEGGPADGMTFMTERKLGKGKIVMLGSMPMGEDGVKMLQNIISHYAAEAGVTLKTDVTPGTIVAPRKGNGYDLWFVINMDGKGGSVSLPENSTDALTGKKVKAGLFELGKYEYRLIKIKK